MTKAIFWNLDGAIMVFMVPLHGDWCLPTDPKQPLFLTISIGYQVTRSYVYDRFGGLCGGLRIGSHVG